ncbi:MAG: D-hexose-6-phosphate mutarotase [Mariprofundales bacterium]
MSQLQALNAEFAITDEVHFIHGEGGLPVAVVSNGLGKASIALQGAHLLSFQAKGEQPLIWMSDDATFAPGKSLRGGIPICWPWFGPHSSDSSLPGHGPARTNLWLPTATASLNDGTTRISFTLEQTKTVRKICAHPLQVQLHITVGSELSLTLETTNLGDTPYMLGDAFHTYFRVGDLRQVQISGLEGCRYLDKVDNMTEKEQLGSLSITSETDRIYLDTKGKCTIVDPVMQRRIIINSAGSASTIVWNPWLTLANTMGDLGENGYLKMLCVETANAASDCIHLAAKATHCLTTTYATEPL